MQGEGIPVVFLHGTLGSARKHFKHQLDNTWLQQKLLMIAPDMRGFSHSAQSRWGETVTAHQVIKDLFYLIHHVLKLERRFFLCGYSLGGIVTLEYVKQYPQDVKGIILVSTLPIITTKVFVIRNRPEKSISLPQKYAWDLIKRFRKKLTRRSLLKRALENPDYALQWKSIQTIPKAILCGKNDTIIPKIAFKQLKNCFPEADIKLLEADHGIPHENASQFNKIFLGFIRKSSKDKKTCGETDSACKKNK